MFSLPRGHRKWTKGPGVAVRLARAPLPLFLRFDLYSCYFGGKEHPVVSLPHDHGAPQGYPERGSQNLSQLSTALGPKPKAGLTTAGHEPCASHIKAPVGMWYVISYKYEKSFKVIPLGICLNHSVCETVTRKKRKKYYL